MTYHPGPDFGANLAAALYHASRVVVVDNTPGARPSVLSEVKRSDVQVVRFGENRGVGAALNRGVEEVRKRGGRWLLTLDQDTSLEAEWGDAVREGYRSGGDATAVIGVRFRNTGAAGVEVSSSTGTDEVARVITSGSLWDLAVLAEAGPFREDFVVDGIDNEMCFRLRSLGYRVVQSRRVVMDHEMGIVRTATWRGRPFLVLDYSTLRYYYVFRNSVELARLYGRQEREWLREDVGWLRWLVTSALVDRRYRKLIAAARGVWDGAFRRFGPAPSTYTGA